MSFLPALRRRELRGRLHRRDRAFSQKVPHAHVVIDDNCELRPGDEVLVHNPPTEARLATALSCGEQRRSRSAGLPGAHRTRLAGNFDHFERLHDVSFTERRRL